MVTYPPLEGHPPTQGWSPTRRKCITDLEFGIYTLLTKSAPGDNCHGWSPGIPRRVSHLPKDGHPPEGSMLQIWILAPILRPQKLGQVKIARNGHLPSLAWSPTNPRMVTLHKEVYSHNSQNEDQVTTAWNGCLSSRGWSPSNPSMVTHHKDVYYRLRFYE